MKYLILLASLLYGQVALSKIGEVHIVKKGETFRSLSKKYYGTTKHWGAIYRADKNEQIRKLELKKGMRVYIPRLITPRFKKHIAKFKYFLEVNGYEKQSRQVAQFAVVSGNPTREGQEDSVGYCHRAAKEIIVSPTLTKCLEAVIYHELLHCVMSIGHKEKGKNVMLPRLHIGICEHPQPYLSHFFDTIDTFPRWK